MLDVADGGITALHAGGGSVYFPVFAPDGKSVLCSSTPPGTTGSMGDQSYAMWQLPVAEPGATAPAGEGRAIAMLGLASARRLAMPRAGGKVAYSALVTSSSVWSLPLGADGRPSGEPRALTEGSGRDSRPLFAPDGATIVFERWRAGTQSDLWLMDAHGGALRQLTSDPAFDSQASWMPDDRSLLFLSGRGGGHGLWRLTLPDDRQTQVSTFTEPPDWIRVSPDGRSVAFHRRQGGATNVWVRDLQSGTERQVTQDRELIAFPIWLPDGRALVCERKRGSETQVVIVPLAGGEPRVLVDDPGQSWPYSVSADGDRVAYAGFRDGVWNVWWISRATGAKIQLTHFTDSNAYVRYPSLSPRGDAIVFERSRTSGDLWLLPSFP
jgi:Tol biopolymer transport system component